MEIKVNVEELKKHKLFVATPMYGGMAHGLYIKSSLDLQAIMSKYGVETKFSFLFNESLITRARNYLVDEFLRTDYTVIINANGTGSITLVTAGTGNITIVGARAIQRTSDYTTGGDLFASTLNTDLDSQTIYAQQVAETAERGLKAPVVDPTDINMTLPAKATRAGTVLAFNATTGSNVFFGDQIISGAQNHLYTTLDNGTQLMLGASENGQGTS